MWLNLLERGKRDIYLCKKDKTQKSVEVFNPPITIRVKKIPVKTNFLLENPGQIGTDTFIAQVTHEIGTLFSLNDRCFVKLMPPSMFDPNCNEADFRVSAIAEGDNFTEIILTGI